MIKESSKTKLILVALLLLSVGPVIFLVVKKNLSKRTQKEPPTTKSLERQIGGFTPLVNSAPQTGFLAPNFALKNLSGQTVTLKDFRGKNILLVFWATTCGWCAAEKDDLIRFTHEQRGKVEVLAVVNEPKETVLKYVKKEGINFAILLDKNRATFEKYQTLGTPAHFLINKNGKITDWRPGYTAYDGYLSMLETLEQ